ncbi:nascent polypeptide-associated complex protein [Archaeoglobales archaeon ex4484_92]|nr:MAG: nascent polypeptide-associated complex protein [Archaeoglobales archaeon ex4484_92]
MLPISPKQMKKMMKQMGIQIEEIDAQEVIIKTTTEKYIFRSPSVTKVTARNVETFQISGEYEIMKEVSDEDLKLVMEQASVDEETARRALEEANGDLAEALLRLQEK